MLAFMIFSMTLLTTNVNGKISVNVVDAFQTLAAAKLFLSEQGLHSASASREYEEIRRMLEGHPLQAAWPVRMHNNSDLSKIGSLQNISETCMRDTEKLARALFEAELWAITSK